MSAIDSYAFASPTSSVARKRRRRRGVLLVRTPDAEHVGVAHAAKRLHVEARIEAAADESNAEPARCGVSIARRDSFLLRRDARLHQIVADAELVERGRRTAVVAGVEDVADVLAASCQPMALE